jgi:hypothetical protein
MEIPQLLCSHRCPLANNLQLNSCSNGAFSSQTARFESESELIYDWRFISNQFVLVPSPLRLTTNNFFPLNERLRSYSLRNILSDGWKSVLNYCWSSPAQSFSGPCPARLRPHSTVSNLGLAQLRGSGPCIYIHQEQDGPVIPPGTEFPFSSSPTTRRATVELFDPASTRDATCFNYPTCNASARTA